MGGIGQIEGPIIGVIVFSMLRELFIDFGVWYLMLLGAVAVVILLLAPHGFWGPLTDRWDIQLFPVHGALISKETKDRG